MLVDGWILVLVARRNGVYFALAIQALVAIVALVVLGGSIHRQLARIHRNVQAGRFVPYAYAKLITIVSAGVLLVLPGFASDAIGLLLYLPPFRGACVWLVARILRNRLPVLDEYVKLRFFSDGEQG